MSYHLIITAEARIEIAEAVQWYEQQAPGLGRRFWRQLKFCLQTMRENPLQFRAISPKYRRALVQDFPYLVFFRVKENEVRILHVLHGSRDYPRLVE